MHYSKFTMLPLFVFDCICFCIQAVGRVLLLQLIDYLTSSYLGDPVVTRLLNSSRVHILPSMNPDGFESSAQECMYTIGR